MPDNDATSRAERLENAEGEGPTLREGSVVHRFGVQCGQARLRGMVRGIRECDLSVAAWFAGRA